MARVTATKGRDTSVLLLLITGCVISGLIICNLLTIDNNIVLPSDVVSVSLIILLLSVTTMMIVIYCKRHDNAFVVYVTENDGNANTLQKIKDMFPVIGLYIFGTGTVILDVLSIAFEIECAPFVGRSGNESGLSNSWHGNVVLSWRYFVSSLLFHLCKIVFFVIQMAFLLQFSSAIFLRPVPTRLITSMCICANCAVWVASYFEEMKEVNKVFGDVETKSSALFRTDNYSYRDRQLNYNNCLNKNTTLGKTVDNAATYLYPFNMEYSLIAIGILYHLWATARADDAHRILAGTPHAVVEAAGHDPEDRGDPIAEAPENCGNRENDDISIVEIIQNGDEVDDSATETKMVVRSDSCQNLSVDRANASVNSVVQDGGYVQFGGNSETSALLVSNTTQRPNRTGILFNLGYVYIILNFVIEILLYDKDIFSTILYVHYGFQSLFYLLLILVSIKCISIIRKLEVTEHAYDEEDLFLLLSAGGTLMFGTLTALAGWNMIAEGYSTEHLSNKISGPVIWIVTFDAMTNFVQVIAQSRLIIRILRVKPSDDMSDRDRKFLFNGVMFLLMSNLALWALDSFVELQSVDSFPLQLKYYGTNWKIIVLLTYPVAIFYRFHSVGILIKNIH